MNKYYKKITDDQWIHRHPLKVLINPILRLIQWRTDKPYVIASDTEFVGGTPNFIKFTFCRVKYNKR